MGQYLEGGAVRTWYEEVGDGEPVVLLHAGLMDLRSFSRTTPVLAEHRHVYLPERRGHGHSPDVDGPITYQVMAEDTIAWIDAVVGGSTDLVGQGDGAVVALLVALQRPDLVDRLVLISAGFDKAGEALPDRPFDVDQVCALLGPAYAEVSPDGGDHFRVVVTKIADMLSTEPRLDKAALPTVQQRTLIMAADDDRMTLDHTLQMYEAMPHAELAVVPGTSQFLVQEKPHLVNALLLDFLTRDPAPTVAPIRRASGPAG